MSDGLREAVERLAEEWAIDPVGDDIWRADAVDALRALLAERPATPAEEVAEVAVEGREAFIDLLVQHPMWIDNDGNDLDYTMEREARIADFVDAAWSQVAALTAKAKAEAWDEGYEAGGDDQINAYWADYSMQANPYREPR